MILVACDENDNGDKNSVDCNKIAIISSEQYESAPNDVLTINSIEIINDSLKLNFSASGCGGDSWDLKLIDSGDIIESYPPQRSLRLSLKNDELCDAYFSKELIFCISNLKVDGDQVLLNLINSDKSILYKY